MGVQQPPFTKRLFDVIFEHGNEKYPSTDVIEFGAERIGTDFGGTIFVTDRLDALG